ncbi:hypothetical protein G3T14_19265 [Methylobacterium sp. BTF04]|uniref:hypothetical protein n=1 Tax=Methylobacterium sp. BTF04 TaxID=2708300 RepID=UPI0013D874B7|nr:hypothetical protein [Methylobacterium sp. BTF04]NEU14250.1 hypothetical protein [Methylobacterium sp. BTF04]
MLTSIVRGFLRFGGFMPEIPVAPRPAPAKRPARSKKAVPAKQAAHAPAPPLEAAPVYKELRRKPTYGLGTACRMYAEYLIKGDFDRLDARTLADLATVMGPEITEWQRALRLTRQGPWRTNGDLSEDIARAGARRLMIERLETWEQALTALDARNREAVDIGWPVEPPLKLPAEVAAALEARRKAALERAKQRARRGASEGGSAPVPVPTEEVAPPLGPR